MPRARRISAATAAVAVFALALAIRVFWVEHVNDPYSNVYSDMQGYIDRARVLVESRPDPYPRFLAFFPPGTHLVYALEMVLLGWPPKLPFLIVHCAWGALVAPCVLLMSLRVVPRAWGAWGLSAAVLFGVLAAAWQPQVTYCGFFSSEELSMGLFAVTSWLLARHIETGRGAVATGLCAGLAYLVRPQFLLTAVLLVCGWIVALAMRMIPPRPFDTRRRRVGLVVAVFGLAVLMGATWHLALTQRPGLIADNEALQRLFADTDLGVVGSSEGGRVWVFSPPSKAQAGEIRRYDFDGYIGDRAKLERIRQELVRQRSLAWRVRHLVGSVELLMFRNDTWPESVSLERHSRRRAYADLFKKLLVALLPFVAIGLVSTALRPRLVLVIAAAQVVTVLAVAAFFWGEARHRVPYDSFLLLLALEGMRCAVSFVWPEARAMPVTSLDVASQSLE